LREDCIKFDLNAELYFRKFYDELKNKGLLSPLTSDIEGSKASDSGTIDYVMPNGSSSIVKHFFEKSGLKIQFDHLVETIVLENNKWTVSTKVTLYILRLILSLHTQFTNCFSTYFIFFITRQLLYLKSSEVDNIDS
jgi:hypothetical protein